MNQKSKWTTELVELHQLNSSESARLKAELVTMRGRAWTTELVELHPLNPSETTRLKAELATMRSRS